MDVWVKKHGQSLAPLSRADALKIEDLSGEFCAKLSKPRNGKHHRLMWALWTYVAKALNDGPTPREWTADDVCLHCKVALGLTDPVKIKGQTVEVPRSISFAKMDQEAFSRFAEQVMEYVAGDLCPWIHGSEHWAEIQVILENARRP